jgi:small subunit ribosomal protein S16
MVSIRLTRMGSKKKPFYRVVVIDSRKSRDGSFIENLGYYNPCTQPSEIKIDVEKMEEWIKKGAKPSETVVSLVEKLKSKA